LIFLARFIVLLDQVTLLLRALQANDPTARLTWWLDVRACRRRRQVGTQNGNESFP
jgi:hypothetical protein